MEGYSSVAIAGLALQLKRGPTRLRLRQLASIDFLLSVVEPKQSYPFDFVRHSLTGFRAPNPDQQAGDRQAGELIPGKAIRADLLHLAEELSETANLELDDWRNKAWSVNDLAERFDVSTKTIFRWHRRGLVGWRFRFPDRRMRLAFPERCVRRFVAENASLVHRGSTFSQLTPKERDSIVDRARQLVGNGEQTVNAVAKVIAGETNRAVETIRLILKRFDEAHPRRGIFNRPAVPHEVDEQRLSLWEAYVDGTPVKALAERVGKPIAWVYGVVTEMRARAIKARAIEFVPSEEFSQPGADAAILDDPHAKAPSGEATAPKRVPSDLPPYLQQLFRIPLLTREGEAALFRQMNYLKYKADRMREGIDPESAKATDLDRLEELLEAAHKVKNRITQANLRLVVSIAKRHLRPGQDFFELVSDGNVSLMRAVERFDYSRGFKFSTYASWAIMKNFARTLPEERRHYDRYQTGREELLEAVSTPGLDEYVSDTLPAVRATVEQLLSSLEDRERGILRQRFGLDNYGAPQTLEQIGKRLGVSKERIRQLEARAMSKLRTDFADQVDALLAT